MKRHWKKIVGAIGLLIVLVVGGSFIYAKVFNKADPRWDGGRMAAYGEALVESLFPSRRAAMAEMDRRINDPSPSALDRYLALFDPAIKACLTGIEAQIAERQAGQG